MVDFSFRIDEICSWMLNSLDWICFNSDSNCVSMEEVSEEAFLLKFLIFSSLSLSVSCWDDELSDEPDLYCLRSSCCSVTWFSKLRSFSISSRRYIKTP